MSISSVQGWGFRLLDFDFVGKFSFFRSVPEFSPIFFFLHNMNMWRTVLFCMDALAPVYCVSGCISRIVVEGQCIVELQTQEKCSHGPHAFLNKDMSTPMASRPLCGTRILERIISAGEYFGNPKFFLWTINCWSFGRPTFLKYWAASFFCKAYPLYQLFSSYEACFFALAKISHSFALDLFTKKGFYLH